MKQEPTLSSIDPNLSAAIDEAATIYDQFNIQKPEGFPEHGMSARAAQAIVDSECWTDANPMLNLSSFVTTFAEPELQKILNEGSFRNFADPDMYPNTKYTEFECVKCLHDLWNEPKDAEPYGSATIGSSEACRSFLLGWCASLAEAVGSTTDDTERASVRGTGARAFSWAGATAVDSGMDFSLEA
jgi:glutamate decarboxylase